jgi:hypothetical protein
VFDREQRETRLAQQGCDRVLGLGSLRVLLLEVRVASAVIREVNLWCGVESAMVLMVSATMTSSASGKSRHDRDVSGLAKEDAEYRQLRDEGNKTNPLDSEVLSRHERATPGGGVKIINSNN